jgi:pectate lyase
VNRASGILILAVVAGGFLSPNLAAGGEKTSRSGFEVAPIGSKLLPAFPGAEGFGAHALGGRGGKVLRVTTLADYDPLWDEPIDGSFRAAVEAKGPRIVVFGISGTIALKAPIWVFNDNLTIAGQTAPGDGVCVRNHPVVFRNEDVIIRYLRFRLGDAAGEDGDALRTASAHNLIIEHCSISWGTDACLRIGRSSHNVTVQWCLISEALNKLGSGYGAVLSDYGLSLHHNLFAHCRTRNPRAINGYLDFRNNVIYDWDGHAGMSVDEEHLWINYVGNYVQPGPSTQHQPNTAFWVGRDVKFFARDNCLMTRAGPVMDSKSFFSLADRAEFCSDPLTIEACDPKRRLDSEDRGKGLPVETEPAQRAYERVLAGAGASWPRRDAVDARVVLSVRRSTGRQIDSQSEVGGWPDLKSAPAPVDSDGDGIPDKWEKAHGLNPHDASDGCQPAADGSGYSNIEVYLNGLVIHEGSAHP